VHDQASSQSDPCFFIELLAKQVFAQALQIYAGFQNLANR